MPPVADEELTAWGAALAELLERNGKAGRKPDSWGSLHAALAALGPNEAKASSWKRTVNRYRDPNKEPPTEKVAQKFAKALKVDRSELPPSKETLSLPQLDRRLRELEARGVRVDQVDRLQRVFAEAIRALAKGDSDQALLLLSHVEDGS